LEDETRRGGRLTRSRIRQLLLLWLLLLQPLLLMMTRREILVR
jgi:hypothetical protein